MLQLLGQINPGTDSGVGWYAMLSALYGIVEGLTEFLPVSSTAHLRLVEDWTGIDMKSGYWKMYSVVIQMGAILSVPVLFWGRIMEMVRTFPRGESGDKTKWTHPLSLVMLGFIVSVGPCYLADKAIGENLESITFAIPLALIIGGIVMWMVDLACNNPRIMAMGQMKPWHAVWIGLVQVLAALFPGTSRSMSTIAAGQAIGLSRSTALEYSFFLSMPTMFAATGYKLLQALLKRPKTAADIANYNAPPAEWLILAIGFVVSFIVAWLVNKWFIAWVKKHGFMPFAAYRVVFGAAILVLAAASRK